MAKKRTLNELRQSKTFGYKPPISKRQKKLDVTYMKMAEIWSKQSHCERAQVGALIVKDKMIISDGYNGMPSGFKNTCEINNSTRWEVLHAEANAILKCAKHGRSCDGATLYLTMSPCRDCSKLIHQAGIIRVVYKDEYREKAGIDFLKSAGVIVDKIFG